MSLERNFGRMNLERGTFTHCGIRHVQEQDATEVSLDQTEFLAAIKPTTYPVVKGAPSKVALDEAQRSSLHHRTAARDPSGQRDGCPKA